MDPRLRAFRESRAVSSDPASLAAERRAAREGLAIALPARAGSLRLRGEDALPFLHRLASCDVIGLAAGVARPGCLLTATGRIRAHFLVLREERGVLLRLEERWLAAVRAAFEAARFDDRVEFETPSPALLTLLGPRAPEALARLGFADAARLPPSGHATASLAGASAAVLREDDPVAPAFTVAVGDGEASTLLDAALGPPLRATPLTNAGLERLRIESGLPRAIDLDESVSPDEAGLDEAASSTKGCYPGQEVVARLRTYGGIRRRLVSLAFEGEPAPGRGDAIDAAGTEVGRITSAAPGCDGAGAVALGFVRRDFAVAGARLGVARASGALAATVAALVGVTRTG